MANADIAGAMSYYLAVWEGPRPATNKAALVVYKEFMNADRESVESTGAIVEYVSVLLSAGPTSQKRTARTALGLLAH